MRNNILEVIGAFTQGVAEGLTEYAQEEQKKQQRKQQQAMSEQAIKQYASLFGINIPAAQEQQEKETIEFQYDMNQLADWKINELRNEVYSIYRENVNSKDDAKRAISNEARELWLHQIPSERRYRATMIKFLCEKGNI